MSPDVGCGSAGGTIEGLSTAAFRVVGVDVSQLMIVAAIHTTTSVIACDLPPLSPNERARLSELAERVMVRGLEVRDTPDGYSTALEDEDSLARDALEWIILERICARFPWLERSFETVPGPMWFRMRGGTGVIEFLADAGVKAYSRST
jgi:hypothetical protein